MNCKIVFTDTAKSDLRDIAIYLADLSKDKKLAIRFVRELQEKVKILEQFPESGAIPRDRVLKSIFFSTCMKKKQTQPILWQFSMENVTICGS